jgi:perosamine synthetase
MDPIRDLARARGLLVIEDAAHALPTRYKGQMIGTVGDFTAFSFYATKTLTTGEGGMVTTERDDFAARMKRMSLHGLSGDAWNRYSDKGQWYYEILDFGFKYNMTDLAAAIGIHQLRRAEVLHKRRRQIAEQYAEAFRDMEACWVPSEVEYGTHAWHLYILRLHLETLRSGRDEIIQALQQKGIGTSVHFIPLHLHPLYRERFGYRSGAFPVAERVFASAISLPIYPRMTDRDVATVVAAVQDTLRSHRR